MNILENTCMASAEKDGLKRYVFGEIGCWWVSNCELYACYMKANPNSRETRQRFLQALSKVEFKWLKCTQRRLTVGPQKGVVCRVRVGISREGIESKLPDDFEELCA